MRSRTLVLHLVKALAGRPAVDAEALDVAHEDDLRRVENLRVSYSQRITLTAKHTQKGTV